MMNKRSGRRCSMSRKSYTKMTLPGEALSARIEQSTAMILKIQRIYDTWYIGNFQSLGESYDWIYQVDALTTY